MNRIILILTFSIMAGCSKTPETYVNDLQENGITREILLQEIDKWTTCCKQGSLDYEAALYNLAFSNGYIDIALTGLVNQDFYLTSQLKYGPQDIFVESSIFQQNPMLAHYGYALALRSGTDIPQNDFSALRHFIIAALLGSKDSFYYMHSIYEEYNCGFQSALVEKLGGAQLKSRGISLGKDYKLTDDQKINVQKNALLFNTLVINKAPVNEYLFDEGCLIDLEVKNMISNTDSL